MMRIGDSQPFGLYEKALPSNLSWEERLSAAARAGYDFVEISIDESEARLARLTSPDERTVIRAAVAATGVPILTMCLSGHRKMPLGSASTSIRSNGRDLLNRAIDFAFDLGIRVIQVAGYDVFYEPRDAGSRGRYKEGLCEGARRAAQAEVMLGLENVDSENLDSLAKGMEFVREVGSPWLQLYPDIGNLCAMGYDPVAEIQTGRGHLVGLHVKDTLPGEVRRIPFGSGNVPFAACFQKLDAIGYYGPMVIEMWSDDRTGAWDAVAHARNWIEQVRRGALEGEPRC